MGVHKRRDDGGRGALDIAIFEGNHEAVALRLAVSIQSRKETIT